MQEQKTPLCRDFKDPKWMCEVSRLQMLPSRQEPGEGLALLLLPQPYGPPGVTSPIKGCCQGIRDSGEQLQCSGVKLLSDCLHSQIG